MQDEGRKVKLLKFFVLILSLFFCFLDQSTKFLARHFLAEPKSVEVVKNFFSFTLTENTGVAFGLFPQLGKVWPYVSFLILLIIVFYVLRVEIEHWLLVISLSLIVGGALGNLIDRLFFQAVTDFIDFRIWPVFNLADAELVLGISLLLIYIVFEERRKLASSTS